MVDKLFAKNKIYTFSKCVFCKRSKFAVFIIMSTKTFGNLKAQIFFTELETFIADYFYQKYQISNNILARSPVLRNIAIASEHFEEAQDIYAETL